MAEVKPYTQEEREAMRACGPFALLMSQNFPEATMRWEATLAAVEKELAEAQRDATFGSDEFRAQYEASQVALARVEKELAEARENARLYNADMMKVREQRDWAMAQLRKELR